MAKWNLNCQTCKKAKRYGYGMCFACDNDECNYEPFPPNTASSNTDCILAVNSFEKELPQVLNNISNNIPNNVSNKEKEKIKKQKRRTKKAIKNLNKATKKAKKATDRLTNSLIRLLNIKDNEK